MIFCIAVRVKEKLFFATVQSREPRINACIVISATWFYFNLHERLELWKNKQFFKAL
jgi:hypothetical protein